MGYLVDLIYKHLEGKSKNDSYSGYVKKRGYATDLGKCKRAFSFSLSNKFERTLSSPWVQMTFDIGNVIESYAINLFMDMGIVKDTQKKVVLKILDTDIISGKIDLIIMADPRNTGKDEEVIVEIKTMSTWQYRNLIKSGIPPEAYPKQLMFYMITHKCRTGFLLFVLKESKYKEKTEKEEAMSPMYDIQYNREDHNDIVKEIVAETGKIKDLLETGEIPECDCKSKEDWHYKYCPYNNMCNHIPNKLEEDAPDYEKLSEFIDKWGDIKVRYDVLRLEEEAIKGIIKNILDGKEGDYSGDAYEIMLRKRKDTKWDKEKVELLLKDSPEKLMSVMDISDAKIKSAIKNGVISEEDVTSAMRSSDVVIMSLKTNV